MRCSFSQSTERHGFVQDSSVGNLSRFRRDGGTPILRDFTSAAHGFGQSASSTFVPELQRGGGVPLFVDLTNMPFQPFENTSFDKANNISSSTVDGMSAAVGFVPELQRDGGVPTLLAVVFDCDAHFRSLYDESSAKPNKTPSTTVNGAAHGSEDDATEFPVFDRDGWDAMGHDPVKITSRL